MNDTFVHLHLHTEYSIVDSIVKVKPLCFETMNRNMPAVAVTDICNLFSMVKFYKEAIQQGVKPIIGSEIWVEQQDKQTYHKIILLCQNHQGYLNLTNIISKIYQSGKNIGQPLAKKSWILENNQGLIALSGAQYGEIGSALLRDANKQATDLLKEWMSAFKNRYFLELQRNNRENERSYESKLLTLSHELLCPVVATNEVVFLNPEDFEAHNARVCIQEGTTLEHAKNKLYSPEQYFKTPKQMRQLFSDLPQAIENTIVIAKKCNLTLTLDHPILPNFPVPNGYTENSYLQNAAELGLKQRLNKKILSNSLCENEIAEINIKYNSRLAQELSVISSMGFSGYFLIVADFIKWAKSHKIPVGPGRGSGAGSLVAYALAITDLDPIEYKLLFERFLNPERVSLPDFDIDFCMDNRDRVIDYVAHQYNRENVSQIATFGTMAAKAVVRDVGRVLGHPYGFVDKIAKLIPFELGITLDKALLQDEVLKKRYQEEEEVKNLIDLAKKLEGITRNVGKHAGGVVIAPSPLTEYAPLFCDKENSILIQFDKDDVESIGLIKFDFLGLKTLTIIDWAVQNANALLDKKQLPNIDIEAIPLDCVKTFSLLKQCATTAIFQLESRGMKELIKRLQPDQFEEIIALVALFRPGPLQSGMVDDFINRKHGRAKVEYLHPAIEPILKPTYGVILYQEQVMQIAQTLAGYTLGGADLLRRAMGKKKPEEMAKQRSNFILGAVERGVEERTATTIFDLMEKFAGYGFNKSHSAAYALVSYQTAWLKTHYPSSFMAAVLSADMNNTDKIVIFIEECKRCAITVIPPHINLSDNYFTVNEASEIVYGLGAIKGVGETAIHDILTQRKSKPFDSFLDFCSRIDHRKVNRRVFEALIKSGALDPFGKERAWMLAMLDNVLKQSEQLTRNNSFGQADMFAMEIDTEQNLLIKPWTIEEKLLGEKGSLGIYFSGHPLEVLEPELLKMGAKKFNEVKIIKKEEKCIIAGIVVAWRAINTKNGDRMAIVTLDDRVDRFEVTFFPDFFQKYRDLLVEDQLLVIEAAASLDNFSGGLRIKAQIAHSFSEAMANYAKRMKIRVKDVLGEKIEKLQQCLILQPRGKCQIAIQYQNDEAIVNMKLDDKWNIHPNQDCLKHIHQLLGENAFEIEY